MNRSLNAVLFVAVLGLAACDPAPRKAVPKPIERPFFTQIGMGSLYSNRFVGREKAAGGRFSQDHLTAAHQHLPFGTIVRVTNMKNGLSIKVAIDDRGPFVQGRVIDLSAAAARSLGIQQEGIANVKLEAFRTDQPGDTRPLG